MQRGSSIALARSSNRPCAACRGGRCAASRARRGRERSGTVLPGSRPVRRRPRSGATKGDTEAVSHPNVTVESLARAAYAALSADDREAFLELVSEDVEFTSMVAEAEGSVFHGHAGVLAWWKRVPDAFEHVAWVVLEVH